MRKRFVDRVVVVTGAGSGIGRATAKLMAQEGATVVLAELDREKGEALAEEIRRDGLDAVAVCTDVADTVSVGALFDGVASRFGRLDVLHNCAGGSVTADAPVGEMDLDVLEHTLALDLKSLIYCSKAALPLLRLSSSPVIVNMSSMVASRPGIHTHAYISAKGGVESLTKAMAWQYAREGVRINAVAPGRVLTERNLRLHADPHRSKQHSWEWDKYPFSVVEPEAIARIVLFLACDDSIAVNGHILHADGGITSY